MKPRVTLLAAFPEPDMVIDRIWQVSKTVTEITDKRYFDEDLIYRLIGEQVPVLRFLPFVFLIEDMTIAFREQLVRTKWDEYWIQSGRITDWTNLRMEDPSELVGNARTNELYTTYKSSLERLVHTAHNEGIKPQDYRGVIPVNAYHRGAWFTNLQSLLTRFTKRSCWIAQHNVWVPVLSQVSSLLRGYHKAFKNICIPPCRNNEWTYTGCPFINTMADRLYGEDPLPPCPIFVKYKHGGSDKIAHKIISDNRKQTDLLERLWGHGIL